MTMLASLIGRLTVKPLLYAIGIQLLVIVALSGVLAVQHFIHVAEIASLHQAEQARVAAESGARLISEQRARAAEQSQARDMAAIGDKHEQDRQAAQAVPAAVVADLRDGRLQLRDDLARCTTQRLSEGVAAAVGTDAHAELRAEVAGDLVQVGRDADDQVRALQAIVRELTDSAAEDAP